MTARASFILKAMNVIFWIIFIGLCINTGAILISFLISLFNLDGAKNLYLGLNLYDLYTFNKLHYIIVVSLIILVTGLKAYIAYLVVRLFLQFNFSKPFNGTVTRLISNMSHVALGTGILAILASTYSDWLIQKGISIPQNWGSSEFLFLAGIIFIIARIFKNGTDIQTENELTV